MKSSDAINELASALSLAQAEMRAASKDTKNEFFKSSYADLASVWAACREPLTKNKLAVIQVTDVDEHGKLFLETTLVHASGQFVSGRYPVRPIDEKPQSYGSAMSYSRRYALGAIVGIVSEIDDDGNISSGRNEDAQQKKGSWNDFARPREPKKPKDPGQTQLDIDPPPVVRSLPDDLCTFYTPFNQYQGVSFREMPDKALKHVGDHVMAMSNKEQKPMRVKWFNAIKEGLVNEIADRPAP